MQALPSISGGPDEVGNDDRRSIGARVHACGTGVRRLLRQPGHPGVEGHDDHLGSARAGRSVLGARRAASHRKRRQSLRQSLRILPGGRHSQTNQRFRHQDRSLAARGWLERQVSGGRERRLGRIDQLCRDGRGGSRRLCERLHRHRARGRTRDLRARSSGKAHRLCVALRARNDREGQSRDPGLLRQRSQIVLLERLLDRRETGPQGSAEIPR